MKKITINKLLRASDVEEFIDELEDGDLIDIYNEFKSKYDLDLNSSWENTDEKIFGIYLTLQAEISQRELDI